MKSDHILTRLDITEKLAIHLEYNILPPDPVPREAPPMYLWGFPLDPHYSLAFRGLVINVHFPIHSTLSTVIVINISSFLHISLDSRCQTLTGICDILCSM